MRCPATVEAVNSLFLTMTPPLTIQEDAYPHARRYTDIDTGIIFYGHVLDTGYRFGMVLPEQPTTDIIMQLVAPLKDGAGWGGVGFGSSMIGPLLFVTWPYGERVMTAPRVATNHTPAGVVPYKAHSMPLTTIKRGTFVNSTHVSSTFLCTGCINEDSFEPGWSSNRDVFFTYAYSQTAVEKPSSLETVLSNHTSEGGRYAEFRVVLSDARSDEYERYAALAGPGDVDADLEDGPRSRPSDSVPLSPAGTGKPEPTSIVEPSKPSSTETPGVTVSQGSETEMPDFSHRQMSPLVIFALVCLSLVYLGQAFIPS